MNVVNLSRITDLTLDTHEGRFSLPFVPVRVSGGDSYLTATVVDLSTGDTSPEQIVVHSSGIVMGDGAMVWMLKQLGVDPTPELVRKEKGVIGREVVRYAASVGGNEAESSYLSLLPELRAMYNWIEPVPGDMTQDDVCTMAYLGVSCSYMDTLRTAGLAPKFDLIAYFSAKVVDKSLVILGKDGTGKRGRTADPVLLSQNITVGERMVLDHYNIVIYTPLHRAVRRRRAA